MQTGISFTKKNKPKHNVNIKKVLLTACLQNEDFNEDFVLAQNLIT